MFPLRWLFPLVAPSSSRRPAICWLFEPSGGQRLFNPDQVEEVRQRRKDQNGVSDGIHLFNDKLREWQDYYNYHRPHGAPDRANPVRATRSKDESWGCHYLPGD